MKRKIKKNNATVNGVKNNVFGMEKHVCPICGKVFYGLGHNGAPIVDGDVCDECSHHIFLARLYPQSYGKLTLAQLKEALAVTDLMKCLFDFLGTEVDLTNETGGWGLGFEYDTTTNKIVYIIDLTFTERHARITLPQFDDLDEMGNWCCDNVLYGDNAIIPLLLERTKEADNLLFKQYSHMLVVDRMAA